MWHGCIAVGFVEPFVINHINTLLAARLHSQFTHPWQLAPTRFHSTPTIHRYMCNTIMDVLKKDAGEYYIEWNSIVTNKVCAVRFVIRAREIYHGDRNTA